MYDFNKITNINDNSFNNHYNNNFLYNIVNHNINKNYSFINCYDNNYFSNSTNNNKDIKPQIINSYNNMPVISNQQFINQINYQNNLNNIGINNINLNYMHNIANNNIKNSNDNNKNLLNLIQNNILEKNNLNFNIFINNTNKKKSENRNISKDYLKEGQQTGLDEFIQYINSLPLPLANYLCTSKGILEVRKKLPKSNSYYKLFIILQLDKYGLIKIMKNTYGNYFFQQIIKDCENPIISLILSYISEDFINISKDSSGTFSLQALLDQITSIEEEKAILKLVHKHEMEMAFDKNATHVLQKLVLLFPDNHRKELNKVILNNIIQLCLDSNGICLVKNYIRTNTILDEKKRINDEFTKNLNILAESPFGNYGIQYLMENWNNNMLNDIKNKIMKNLYNLSIQQYSSNVVEKAIEIFEGEYRKNLIKKLCFEDNFVTLLNNKFGRFVLYKAVNYMNNELKNEFESNLENKINNNIYNKKDLNQIKRFLLKMKYRINKNNCILNNSEEEKED